MASHIFRILTVCLQVSVVIFFGINVLAYAAKSKADSAQRFIIPGVTSKRAISSHLIEPRFLNFSAFPAKTIRVSVVVNEDHFPIPNYEIENTFSIASSTLESNTGFFLSLHDIDRGHFGDEIPEIIFDSYLFQRLSDLPDYVVVLTKTGTTLTYGGYQLVPPFGERILAFQSLLQGNIIHCNSAGSPYNSPGVVYGTAIDWNHIIGRCGYEIQDNEYVHVSNTSINGECRNTPRLECVYYYERWRCPNLIADPEFAAFIENHNFWLAFTIIHELLHNFGYKSGDDHVCSPDLPDTLKNKSAYNMCGEVIDTFQWATQKCTHEPRPIGSSCQYKQHCDNSYCYSFWFSSGESFYCSVACNAVSDCPVRLGKTVQCRTRNENDLAMGKACFYRPAFQ